MLTLAEGEQKTHTCEIACYRHLEKFGISILSTDMQILRLTASKDMLAWALALFIGALFVPQISTQTQVPTPAKKEVPTITSDLPNVIEPRERVYPEVGGGPMKLVPICSAAAAQGKTDATVEVKDEFGDAVSGAQVMILPISSKQTCATVLTTDSNGMVSLKTLLGTYSLSVTMPGFIDLIKQVVLTDTNHQTFAVVLQEHIDYNPNYSGFLRLNGAIPDGETAIAVSEAIFRAVFGKDHTAKFEPYHVRFDDGLWIIYGTLKKGSRGGTPMLKIQKSDGKVLEVWHSQ